MSAADVVSNDFQKARSRILVAILVLLSAIALIAVVRSVMLDLDRRSNALHSHVENGFMSVSSMSDGPYVVTHVAFHSDGEGSKVWAALPQTVAVVDSAGASFSVKGLKWTDIGGRPANEPDLDRCVAVYQRAEYSVPRLPSGP
ncbi:MAG: hypothetical protein JST30_00535 [Armatimonadetes bacterium]|nr:hypothetical protein [Armatimonadota bacterium]